MIGWKIRSLGYEIGNKHIGFSPDLAAAVRCEHQLAAVMGEHGKTVEAFVMGDSLDVTAIDVDHVKVEVATFRVMHVG